MQSLNQGESIMEVSRKYGISRDTIKKYRNSLSLYGSVTAPITGLIDEQLGSSSLLVIIFFRLTFLLIKPFSVKIPVNIVPGSWSFLFFLLISRYEFFTKIDEEPTLTRNM
jgi:hypothetical protein